LVVKAGDVTTTVLSAELAAVRVAVRPGECTVVAKAVGMMIRPEGCKDRGAWLGG
jgi:hypothetical protein